MNNKEGLSHEAEEQSSRIYFCQVKAPTFSAAKKVVVTKTWNDLKPPKTTYNHLKKFNNQLQPSTTCLLYTSDAADE